MDKADGMLIKEPIKCSKCTDEFEDEEKFKVHYHEKHTSEFSKALLDPNSEMFKAIHQIIFNGFEGWELWKSKGLKLQKAADMTTLEIVKTLVKYE